LQLDDAVLASETCEELFTPDAPHISLGLAGVEVFSNGSGSHHQLRKLDQRLNLILSATAKAGGVYLYANQRGCDGGRLYFDGCACVAVNGHLLAQGAQFGLAEVEVVAACVDLDEVESHRGAMSTLREQASVAEPVPLVRVDFKICR
jgi:NAD+ synthase (glutamine-hydrolysing)